MSEVTEGRPKRRWRIVGVVLLSFVVLHFVGEAIYSSYVAASLDAWREDHEVDENGILVGCDAYDLPPADSPVVDTAVLLVHGFNASPRHWDLIAPELSKGDCYCRVTRLPGFAEPDALTDDHDAQRWVDTVRAELDKLRAEHDRVGVVGHSLGGAVTIRTLLDDPKAADYAVLVAPAVAVSDVRAPVLSTRTWHEVSQRTFWLVSLMKSPFPMDCHVEGRTDWPGRMPFSSPKIVDALFTLLDRNLPEAERFTTPVTVFVSPTDQVVDTAAAEAYYERLASDDKKLVILEKSGHAVPLDSEWETVADAIAERALASESTETTGEPPASAGGVVAPE